MVTVTWTVPLPAGALAARRWLEKTVKPSAAVAPKYTADAVEKLSPKTLTTVPPVVGPEDGSTPVTIAVLGMD